MIALANARADKVAMMIKHGDTSRSMLLVLLVLAADATMMTAQRWSEMAMLANNVFARR